ncbi:MAG: tRNA epoxyqueuosine(34) reductase QueG [Anaerolineae bacterium]|nr:tRNA epoxyqueuosine(34) reductase QueG [Anaerolineae bacterium]
MSRLHQSIQAYARQLGFDRVGVTPAAPPAEHLQAYREWLARGDHGEMGYMARPDRVARREDPALVLPGVRSVVCVASSYAPAALPETAGDQPRGRISCYAWGEDYHDWMLPRMEELAARIVEEAGGTARYRAYVDTGPVLERAFASRAGLGFIGKNNCLVHPRRGSWLFLGVILTDAALPPTGPPLPARCGRCTRCVDACPTGALAAPYRLDARRCISYLTIELKGPIPRALRPLLGDRIYGCDACQEACPWQRFASPTAVAAFRAPSPERARPALFELMALDEEGFQRRFRGSPIQRLQRGRLLRNVAVALGNSGDRRATPVLAAALADPDPLVRGHAAWALGRLAGPAARAALQAARERETEPLVRQELAAALAEVGDR